MSLIAKTGPVKLDSARRCFLKLPLYGEVEPLVGEPIFIWISETKGGDGLTYRGEVEALGDGSPLPLVVRVFGEQPSRPLTKADLLQAPSKASGLSGLAEKLYRHSLHKIAALTAEEAELLTSHFPQTSDESQRADQRAWWQPVLDALQKPGEPAPRLYTNNVRVPLPWPGTWVTAYVAGGADGRMGVFLGGSDADLAAFWTEAKPRLVTMRAALQTPVTTEQQEDRFILKSVRRRREFATDQEQRAWLSRAADDFATVLRPVMRELLGGASSTPHSSEGAWQSKGVVLPPGTQLRMRYNGRDFTGTIEGGQFVVEGQRYSSPSAAASAVAITRSGKRTNLNGWTCWEARLPNSGTWQLLDDLHVKANPSRARDGEELLRELGLLDD